MAADKRVRRTPAQAKRLILDAAEASMGLKGPAGLRLQDVARAAGISHSSVLHHFGSRAGLIEALNQRTLDDLKSALFGLLGAAHSATEVIIGKAFAAYRNGLAQRTLWVLRDPAHRGAQSLPVFEEIVEALHARRLDAASRGIRVDKAQTRAIVHLTTVAAFGDALIGARLRQHSRTNESAARRRFERWFAALLDNYAREPSQTSAGRSRVRNRPARLPFDVYKELDLAPGGYAIASSSNTRAGVRSALKRKHGR